MNPRTRQLLHKTGAVAFFLLGFVLIILAFRSTQEFFGPGVQFPGWWVGFINVYHANFSWWPVVIGLLPETYYSAKIYFTIALGLVIFLPQVETTFVSLIRRRSPIGAPYVDRTHFTCPVCGTVNRPSVQFCVKCGSQIHTGTRYWEKPTGGQGSISVLKDLLVIISFLGLFLGCFDTTIYSALTGVLGTDYTTVLLATVVSVVPSVAGYAALKEGPFRKYASLKQFDRIAFGNEIWIIFGLLFIILAVWTFLSGPTSLPGEAVLFIMQGILGVLLISYPTIRKRFAKAGSQTISFDDSRVW